MGINCQYTAIIIIIYTLVRKSVKGEIPNNDWKAVEALAEQHPYIVALLDNVKNYSCTGTIINKRTVLTSGTCVSLKPRYVAVGVAIISNASTNNIIDVAYTILHEDYNFELKIVDTNITKTHNNIGLVFVVESILQLFIPEVNIGNYYATELNDKSIIVVGYGLLTGSKMIGLQKQTYRQAPCSNPKWYYCICGIEYFANSTIRHPKAFGKGAPALLKQEIIGIAASPCGTLSMSKVNYNIFTVIGPYTPWIHKTELSSTFSLRTQSNNNCDTLNNYLLISLYSLLIYITFLL